MKEEFLKERGWEYGRTRDGWFWAHPVTGPGFYFTLEAAYEIEVNERLSERQL